MAQNFWSSIPNFFSLILKVSHVHSQSTCLLTGGGHKYPLKLWGQDEHQIELNNLVMGKIINGERLNMACVCVREGERVKAGAQVEGRISSKSHERFNSGRSGEWQCLWRHATKRVLNYVWHLTVCPPQFMYFSIKSIKWGRSVLMELLGIKATARGVCLGSLSARSSTLCFWLHPLYDWKRYSP